MTEPAPQQRDRLLVHLIWEAVLLVLTAAIVIALFATEGRLTLSQLLIQVAPTGLAAAAIAFSLRTGTPNLAVGAIAALTGVIGAQLAADLPTAAALVIGVAAATGAGVVLGLVTAALSVPAWAVTLGGAFLIEGVSLGLVGGQVVALRTDGNGGVLWFFVFAVISLGGAALWLVPGVRGALSGSRRSGVPGAWAGVRPGLGGLAGLAGSSLLAGLAGVALVLRLQAASPAAGGTSLTVTALAAALLGGVSIFGRRAGVAGVLLASVFVTAVSLFLAINSVDRWVTNVLIGLLVLVGLGVSRALESVTNAVTRGPAAPVPPQYPPAVQ